MSENRFTAENMRSQATAILQAWGMSCAHAITTADLMVETDLLGVDSHGVSMLPQYAVLRRNGRLRLDTTPTVLRDGPATALIDAGAGLGHVASAQAMQLAVDKARACIFKYREVKGGDPKLHSDMLAIDAEREAIKAKASAAAA